MLIGRSLRIEQLQLVNNNVTTGVVPNLLVAPLLTLFLYPEFSADLLVFWVAMVYLVTFVRVKYHQRVSDLDIESKTKIVERQFTAYSILAGFTWGSSALLFFPAELDIEYLSLALVLAGFVSGYLGAGSILPKLFYAFAIPALLPIIVMGFLNSNKDIQLASMLFSAYLFSLLLYCHSLSKGVLTTLSLRFENRELIEKLKIAQSRSERASHAKTQFLAATSHDLRQPLHAHGLFLENLRSEIHTARGQRLYAKLESTKSALDEHLFGLLDISRLDAGVIVPELAVFNIETLTELFEEEFHEEARRKGLFFRVNTEPVYVHTDKLLLERIVRNLLTNAIRYTNRGSVSLNVKKHATAVDLEIIDTGIGISQKYREEIFAEYVQLNNPERDRSRGLGLGLSIVRRLADLLNIEIILESNEGQGTLIRLTLNTCEKPDIEHEATCDLNLTPSSNHKCHVLVIDDEIDILDGMAGLLKSWSYSATMAESAENAIELLVASSLRPDVIIADYRLRNHRTGADAITQICDEFNLNIPGVIITGDTSPKRLSDAKKSGNILLHKPIKPDALHAILASLDK